MTPFSIPRSRWMQIPDRKKLNFGSSSSLGVKLTDDNKRARDHLSNQPSTSLRDKEKYHRFLRFIVHISFIHFQLNEREGYHRLSLSNTRPQPDVNVGENKTDHNIGNMHQGVRALTPRSNRKSYEKNVIIIIVARWNAPIDSRNQVITIIVYWRSFSIIVGNQLPTTFIYSRNAGLWWIKKEIDRQFSLNMYIT